MHVYNTANVCMISSIFSLDAVCYYFSFDIYKDSPTEPVCPVYVIYDSKRRNSTEIKH